MHVLSLSLAFCFSRLLTITWMSLHFSAIQIAFGENIDSLHKEVPFATAFNRAQVSIDDRVFFPLWRVMPFLPSERRLRASLQVLDEFAFGLVRTRRSDPNVAEKKDLLSRYVAMRDENEQPFSDTYLRDMILNVSS